MKTMKTIYNVAEGLAKAFGVKILRLDIQFSELKDERFSHYCGYLYTTDDRILLIREDASFEWVKDDMKAVVKGAWTK